jgi:hypothetical protein
MNQNGDERRIQQLFREMSRDDELRTPAFSRVMQGANSRTGATTVGVSRRFVLTFATLCVVVITLAILTLRHQTPVDQISESPQPPFAEPGTTNVPSLSPSVIKTPRPRAIVAVRHIRHRRPVNELAIAMKLSTWRSPTASLLKTSSDDKLMSLPTLGDSLRTLRFYSVDELN